MKGRKTPNEFEIISVGEPVEAMEAAKRLVLRHDLRDVETLILLASTKSPRLWSRIAAIWTLGLIDDDAISGPILERISQDANEPAEVRDHALEALEHIGP